MKKKKPYTISKDDVSKRFIPYVTSKLNALEDQRRKERLLEAFSGVSFNDELKKNNVINAGVKHLATSCNEAILAEDVIYMANIFDSYRYSRLHPDLKAGKEQYMLKSIFSDQVDSYSLASIHAYYHTDKSLLRGGIKNLLDKVSNDLMSDRRFDVRMKGVMGLMQATSLYRCLGSDDKKVQANNVMMAIMRNTRQQYSNFMAEPS